MKEVITPFGNMSNNACQLMSRGNATMIDYCQPVIDETLKHLDLGFGIVFDYHWPIPLKNWIGAILIIGCIILVKKWKIKNDKESEEEPDD